jgi:GDP-mannose 6-dehydrogenase
MKISIFGLGYVGCVSLGCLAQNGHTVIGVDTVYNKVNLINQGKPTIIEKDIDDIIEKQFQLGRISATENYKEAILNTEISIICVGTPSTPEGHLNLKYIYKVAEQIGESLRKKDSFHIVVIRSTVLLGTNNAVGKIISKASWKKRNQGFTVVSNPEFLREGSAVKDYYNPAITVLGGDHETSLKTMGDVYKDVNAPIEYVGIEVAEVIKYVNNSFHALKITFANEVGNICKKLNIDSHKVMDLFCKDDHLNISPYYFKPGFAYGGSCLPKDLKGLKTIAYDNYLSSPVLNSIEESNSIQKQIAYEMILETGKRNIAILGLSFKAGTDDLRYSPIVEVAERLLGKGYQIRIFDKKVNFTKISGTNKDYIDSHIPHLSDLISDDFESVVNISDVVVITQKDKLFMNLFSKYPHKIVIDLVRITRSKSHDNYRGICW